MKDVSQRIEVEISGGIGNQLFQYAAALAMAQSLNRELILDVSWYERQSQTGAKRQLELDKFFDLSKTRTLKLNRHPKIELVLRKARNYRVIYDTKLDSRKFNSFSTRRHVRMKGYWQSESYFTPVTDLLRFSYSNHLVMSTLANEIARQISSSPSLGVHVRRGDYISNVKTRSFHGVCEREYFARATELVMTAKQIDKIYVFSDDIKWCKENLELNDRSVLIEHVVSDTEQLKLLSLCKHHVISNSSFSWWAAWFGFSQDQVVVYPGAWFSDGSSLENMPVHWTSL